MFTEPNYTVLAALNRCYINNSSLKFHRSQSRNQPQFAFALHQKPFSPCLPPLAAPFLSSPRATARICDRSISNPFSRHSGARVNNPPLMRIVHLLRHVPGASGRKRFLTAVRFHISDSGKILLCAPPELGEGGKGGDRPTFFLYNPSPNPLGNCKQPLVVHFEPILRPPSLSGPLSAIYCALKCTLHHSGFGTADCNNFYNPRTSLDVTPTQPRGPIYTHREGGGWT